MGWVPKVVVLGRVTTEERALLAILIALYPMPAS